jgi:two-component system, chemotaxis family, CheB/CheR fusion protein
VGSDLTIRRFTPQAQKVFGLIPSDIGRPFTNINPTIDIPEFQPMVMQVLSDFHPVEKIIKDRHDGHYRHYRLRIVPYRVSDNKIDGAVVTVIGVSPKAAGAS